LFCDVSNHGHHAWGSLWDELASNEDKTKLFAKVDSTQNPQLVKRFSITHVPALLLFKDRQVLAFVPAPPPALPQR
jgi:thioredoxin-like negative regulator of GroEL